MAESGDRMQRYGPDGRIARIPTPTGFPVGDINSYVILPQQGSDQLVLVDSGVRSDGAWEAMQSGLAALGHRIEDVSLLILTHAHPDHFGQAAAIARRAGCEVWAHRDAQAAIDRYALEAPPERLELVRAFWERLGVPAERARRAFGPPGGSTIVEYLEPDRLLEDGDRVEVEGLPLDVIHTPGHCPDLVVFWQPDTGTVLAGDHLLPDITPVCLLDIPTTPAAERVHTLAQFHESIDKVEPLAVKLLLPSHGDPLKSHKKLIADYRLHTAERMLKIARLLKKSGEATPFELARIMFPKVWDPQLHLVLSEVLGHLDLLERDGNAICDLENGVLRYRFVSLPEA